MGASINILPKVGNNADQIGLQKVWRRHILLLTGYVTGYIGLEKKRTKAANRENYLIGELT